MIQPKYVTFEQAKKLKEKGFDEECMYHYKNDGTKHLLVIDDEYECQAPEQWQVVEWLHVVHGIQLFLDYTFYDGFHYGCKYVKSNGDYGEIGEIWKEGIETDIDGVDTPQEAYSATFDYVLNNLI